MTRFADTHTRLTDDYRVREILDHEAKRIDRQFAPARKAAAANVAAWNVPRTFALA
jgi:hypothetical protein